jgi:hypothetical protein
MEPYAARKQLSKMPRDLNGKSASRAVGELLDRGAQQSKHGTAQPNGIDWLRNSRFGA